MASIDERIVEMRFNRDDFNQGVAETLAGLQRLDDTLAGSGGIADNVERVSSKFTALGALGFTAVQRLGNAAMDAGGKIISQVIDPLFEGGKKRALNIEQARFQFQGLGMDVEASMEDALYAVKGTAFGLDEAAVVAAQFGASGMRAGDDMRNALRGISGVAAMAGTSYSDVGNIFTKVAGQGRLMGDDLLRLSTRSINAAATIADYYRKTGKDVNATEASVRELVTKGQVDFETFAAAMDDAFGEHATKANETYTGSLSNMRAAIARIGASFASVKLERHRRMFNALTPVIDKVADSLSPVVEVYQEFSDIVAEKFEARALYVLENFDWKGLQDILGNISRVVLNLKKAFDAVVTPIKNAFKAVFDAKKDGDGFLGTIAKLTDKIESFSEMLIIGEEGAERIQAAFQKVFEFFKMGLGVIDPFKNGIARVGEAFQEVGNVIRSIVPSWGVELHNFGAAVERHGGGVEGVLGASQEFFNKYKESIKEWYQEFRDGENVFDSFSEGFDSAMGRVRTALSWLADVGRSIVRGFMDVWNMLGDALNGTMGHLSDNAGAFERILHAISPILEGLRDAAAGFLAGIGNAFRNEDPLVLFMGLQTIMGNIIGMKFADGFKNLFSGLGGIGDSIKGVGESISGFLNGIREPVEQTKTTKIFLIAASVLALAYALKTLSEVPQDRLLESGIAITAITGALMVAMGAMNKVMTAKDIASLPTMALGMALFSAAVFVMANALKAIGSIPEGQLWNAVGAIAALSMVMTVMADRLSEVRPGKVMGAAFAMGVMAGAVLLLSSAVAALGALPFETVLQGGIAVIAMIGLMVGASVLLDKFADDMLMSALGLMAMAAALNMMVVPIAALGMMPFAVLDVGMRNLALVLGGLVVAAIALNYFAGDMLMSALGLMAMAAALNMMVPPILILGYIPFENLVKGLYAVTVALLALVVAAAFMERGVVGALGLIAISAAMVILAVAIGMLAALPYEAAWAGLTLMAAGLVTMLAAAMVGQMVLPGLLGLAALVAAFAVAVLAMGTAMVLAAVGVSIFAAALPLLTLGLAGFAAQAGKIALGIPILAALGVAMIPLAAAALALGAGMVLLGAGMALLSGGLMLLSVTGPAGTLALMAFFSALNEMGLKQMAKIALLTVEFAAMGAALLVLGAGLVLTGAGALLAAAGLALLAGGAALVTLAGNAIKRTFSGMEPIIANIEGLGSAFTTLAASLTLMGSSLSGLVSNLAQLAVMLVTVGTAITMLATVSGSTSAMVVISFTAMATGLTVASVLIKVTTGLIVSSISSMGLQIMAIAPLSGAAAALMISLMVQSLQTGRSRIVSALDAIVYAFAQLVVLLASSNRPTSNAAKTMITNVAKEIESGEGRINRAITSVSKGIGKLADNINQNRTKVSSAAKNLTRSVETSLAINGASAISRAYTVGINVASGMANGIRAGGGRVASAARAIALSSMNSAKSALGVASPSREFYEIAGYVIDGFVGGLNDGEKVVGNASRSLGDETMDAMRDIINDIFREFDDISMLDFSPTITPVLDLDTMRDQATGMGGILGPMGVDASFNRAQASGLAILEDSLRSVLEDSKDEKSTGDTYIQNIYSPEAVSAATIYRQTRNQISSARSRRRD